VSGCQYPFPDFLQTALRWHIRSLSSSLSTLDRSALLFVEPSPCSRPDHQAVWSDQGTGLSRSTVDRRGGSSNGDETTRRKGGQCVPMGMCDRRGRSRTGGSATVASVRGDLWAEAVRPIAWWSSAPGSPKAERRQSRLASKPSAFCWLSASGIAPVRVWLTMNVHLACQNVNTLCADRPILVASGRRALT
jgi:hypothetical protein